MAVYGVLECLTGTKYFVSASTLTINSTISFTIDEQSYCGRVSESASTEHNAVYLATYQDCCDCIQQTDVYSSFTFKRCDNLFEFNVSVDTFCNIANFTPIQSQVFIFYETENPQINFCAQFLSGSSETGVTTYEPEAQGPYTSCEECTPDLPRSANTESFICEICCPCTTGATINSVAPPHPVWTDGRGIAVTQLNMVVLGGENGLNS